MLTAKPKVRARPRRPRPEDHEGLVKRVAAAFEGRGVEFEDLVQAGNMGLMRACGYYRRRLGKFSTIASYWVKLYIRLEIRERRSLVRVPPWVQEEITRRASAERAGRAVAPGPPRREALIERGRSILSRGMVRDDPSREGSLVAHLASVPAEAPARAERREAAENLRAALSLLPAREREYLGMLHGLDGAGPATLEEIGRRDGVTRERARQVCERARRRLRAYLTEDGGLAPPARRLLRRTANHPTTTTTDGDIADHESDH